MNPYDINCEMVQKNYQDCLLERSLEKHYKLTPFITTFCEGDITSIDIRNFLEMGMKIIRFKMGHVTKRDKLKILQMIKDAAKWCCEKHQVSTWPITLSVDIPNACIKTGLFKEEIDNSEIDIRENWLVEITAAPKYWNRCDSRRIYIDDPYTIKNLSVGTEITIRFGHVVMIVDKVVDDQTLICKVVRGGKIESMEFVCIRGVKHTRPPLSKLDLDLIKFAKDLEIDIITINSLRRVQTLKSIKKLFSHTRPPLFVSAICEQEGLDNIDEIIKFSDGIILAREFMACEIVNPCKMVAIQMKISAKCKQNGVPFYISGNILERTLTTGTISGCDIDDVTNAVLQGAGILLRDYKNPAHVLQAINYLNEICKAVEPLTSELNNFWRMIEKCRIPVNAAEANILGCAMMAKVSEAKVIVVLTVTGMSATWLSEATPEAIILAVCKDLRVARRLLIRRGVIPIVYDGLSKVDWCDEMDERIKFAVSYGLRNGFLTYGARYVAFKKSSPASAFCDNVSTWTVVTEENTRIRLKCPY